MDPRHLLRLARAARQRHSLRKVVLIVGLTAVCIAIWAVERHVGWPEALSVHWTRPPMRVP